MTIINELPVEDYLYGVIPWEIEGLSHPEAIKAQAIVARNYTLNTMGKMSKWGFDMDTTTRCQVYKGYDGEYPTTNKAVDETVNKLIRYNGTRASAVFYFSSSGGRTEDVSNVWGSNIPYLKSVEDKHESGRSYRYNWQTILNTEKLKDILTGRGYNLGEITGVEVVKRSEAGRVVELFVKGTKGEQTFTLESCRNIFYLDSQWYTITTAADAYMEGLNSGAVSGRMSGRKAATASGVKDISTTGGETVVIGANGLKRVVSTTPTAYIFTGKGWGHAVGMSQEGAKGMADAGYKHDEILRHYFVGTQVD